MLSSHPSNKHDQCVDGLNSIIGTLLCSSNLTMYLSVL